jgi:endonuclease-3
LEVLSTATIEDLFPYVSKVRNFNNKSSLLIEIAQTLKSDKNSPTNLNDLSALNGIVRKSANVVMREMKVTT